MSESALPPLNWLRAFEASARQLSFTGAAVELGMTQSAVSQQIKSLENHLRRPLFLRQVRRLELTEAGRGYLPVVQEAFATLARGTRSIVGDNREQVLQIQSNLAFSVHWLAPRLDRLFAAYPWLRVNISTALWDPEKTAQSADVEIRFGRGPGEGVAAEKLGENRFYPVARPGFRATLEHLDDVHLFDCAGIVSNWQAWMQGQGRSLPRNKAITYASTYVVGLSAAEAGGGLALSHDMLAGHLIREGRVVRPFEFSAQMVEAYYLIAPPRSVASPAVVAFVDWLEGEMKSTPAGSGRGAD